jgi:signal transduction histidine kinase
VDGWGAEVTLESAVGSGTTVTIRLRAPIPAIPRLSV